MQRQIVHGIPYFTDSINKLYVWDHELPNQCIGTYNSIKKTVEFNSNHLEGLREHLTVWRSKQIPRSRKPVVAIKAITTKAITTKATNSGGNGANTDRIETESFDTDP
jgi:hypothetical protein